MANKSIVLITGATSGIGKATAKLFAKKGYKLIITGRRKKKLKDVAEALTKKYKTEILALTFDVRKLTQVTKAISSLPKAWQNIDILINNAGLAKGYDPIHEGNIDDWETMIDTNIKGLLYMTRQVAPLMVKNGRGHIINVASTAGKEVYPNGNVYCATKHAVDALTKGMRIDLHKHGLKIGQVAPGHVEETEFALVRFDGNQERAKIYEDFTPINSKDVARVIYFMSTQPKHVNIQDILVMGTQQANCYLIDRKGRL